MTITFDLEPGVEAYLREKASGAAWKPVTPGRFASQAFAEHAQEYTIELSAA